MVELTVWTFATPYGAEAVVNRLQNLCARDLIRIHDAALVSWPERRPVPLVRPLGEIPRSWKLDDAFWGLLAGMLFHHAQLPAWQTEEPGHLSEGMAALGIDEELLAMLRGRLVRGTSALLLLLDAENARRIAMSIDGMSFTFAEAPLSPGQVHWLRCTFSAFAD
jgi:uncharacterized membrane protein